MEQEKDAEAIAKGEFELSDDDMTNYNENIEEQIMADAQNIAEVEEE